MDVDEHLLALADAVMHISSQVDEWIDDIDSNVKINSEGFFCLPMIYVGNLKDLLLRQTGFIRTLYEAYAQSVEKIYELGKEKGMEEAQAIFDKEKKT